MKKMLCLLLAVLLLASVGAPVLAEGSGAEQTDPLVHDKPELGFHFVTPEKYRNYKGSPDWSSHYLDDGLLQITLSYYAFPEEDFDAYNDFVNAYYNALLAGEEPPEPADPKWATGMEWAGVYDIFTINADRGEKELREELKEHNGLNGDDFSWLEKIGSDGEFSFFVGQYAELEENREEYRRAMGEEYFAELEDLASDHETFLQALTLHAPEYEQNKLESGDVVSFETTDLDGNPVNSRELFAGSRVTMINLWATWCVACKKELPELSELAMEFEKKGCRIVGICLDADEEGMAEVAKEILEQNGVAYLNLAAPEDVETLLPTVSFPTSFFFDSQGRMVVEPVLGALVEQYLPTLDAALAEIGGDEIDYTTGTPWMDIDLEGNVTPDTPTDLKDNYALWVNKDRILSMEYPEGYIAAGNTSDVNYKADQDLKALFGGEAPEDHDARLAYDYYYLLSDWDARDARGVEPLKDMVAAVEGIADLDALTAYFVKTPWEDRLSALWREKVRQDPDKPGWNILSVNAGYSFLNDPAEYLEMTEDGKAIKETVDAFCMEMLAKFGYSEAEAEQKIENCFAWETLLNTALAEAEAAADPEDPSAFDVHYTRDELLAATPNIPIVETLEKVDGYPVLEQVLLPEPAAIECLNRLYTEENLPLMRDYLILHGIYLMAEALDWDSYVRACDCQEVASGGAHMEVSREDYANSLVYDEMKGIVGWPLSKYYVQQHTNPEDKVRISELVDEIVDAYYGIIEDADFISAETRAGAVAKLDCMAKHVLYPDSWEPYSFEDVNFASKEEGGRLWEAWRAIKKHEHEKTIAELISPIDSTVWDLLPCIGNCGYTPGANAISINAAYAQAPNYRPDMTDEELYAYMGTAVAHEISHAFDAFGAKFDKDGNITDWWTEEDYAAFNRKNEKLIAYFNAMHPWEGQDFDGEIMVGEACADMAAVKCMLRIAAGKPDFDYDRFFRAFADRFATKETLFMAMARLEDEHPMAYLRINTTLQQYDEFLDFYGITEGDNMYLAPEDRVTVW